MIEVAKKEHDLLEKNCEDFEKLWASYGSFYKNLILDYAEKLPESDRTIIEQIMRKTAGDRCIQQAHRPAEQLFQILHGRSSTGKKTE